MNNRDKTILLKIIQYAAEIQETTFEEFLC